MPFTGDLEQLHIVDVIQLLHTTRKSGTFAVKGDLGQSRIIFSNGYIVGASHLNRRIRIGSVLVKSKLIESEVLQQVLEMQKKAGKERKPLLISLVELGKLSREDAVKGLKKLIEITMVELIGWSKGTFTFDTEAIMVSDNCSYLPGQMEQEMSLDAQMVLMDALRVFDERERDRSSGKDVPSYEELYADSSASEETAGAAQSMVITADDLGLSDLDHLEKKISKPFSVTELFDPHEIHGKKIRELLHDFPADAQDAFIAYLEQETPGLGAYKSGTRAEQPAKALILFSTDELITHSIMTLCKNEGVMVFTTDDENEFDQIINQCLTKRIMPILMFDSPDSGDRGLSGDRIVSLRQWVKEKYPRISTLQIAPPLNYTFMLNAFHDRVRAVFPKPPREAANRTFVDDTIAFLQAFRSYIKLHEEQDLSGPDERLRKLRDRLLSLRDIAEPADVSAAVLQFVGETFERAITFFVRSSELIGEQALGLGDGEKRALSSAGHLRIPLTEHSKIRSVIETGSFFYGESDDTMVRELLHRHIGAPLRPTMLLLPMRSRDKIITVTYGDFGRKEVPPVNLEMLEMLVQHAGLVIETAVYRKQAAKSVKK